MRNTKIIARKPKENFIEKEQSFSTLEIALVAADAAIEKQALHPVLMDLQGGSAIADYFLLLSAGNEKQLVAISDAILSRLKEKNKRALSVEGRESAQWILIDLGDLIVHVFHADARVFYDLDGLWSDAERIKIPGVEKIDSDAW